LTLEPYRSATEVEALEARRRERSSAYESLGISVIIVLAGWSLVLAGAIYIPILAVIAGGPMFFLPAIRTFSILRSLSFMKLLLCASPLFAIFALALFGFRLDQVSIPVAAVTLMVPSLFPLVVVHVAAFRRLRS